VPEPAGPVAAARATGEKALAEWITRTAGVIAALSVAVEYGLS
jgi:hypothetical protein